MVDSARRPTTIPRGLDGQIDHLLLINDVRVALAKDLPKAAGKLVWWRSDWELREECRRGVIPDALFAVSWGGGKEQAYALEVDNNTRSVRSFLKKMTSYVVAQRELLQ